MKKIWLILLVGFVVGIHPVAFAEQQQYSACFDGENHPEAIVHCVVDRIDNAKPGVCKYLREDWYLNDKYAGSSIACAKAADSTVYYKENIKKGKYKSVFSQCDNSDCLNTKMLGSDTFNVDENHVATPRFYTVAMDDNYGDTLSPPSQDDEYSFYLLMNKNSGCDDSSSAKSDDLYCATVKNSGIQSKYLKVTIDHIPPYRTSYIVCADKKTRVGVSMLTGNGKNVSTQVTFSQCDNAQCLHPIAIGKDKLDVHWRGDQSDTSPYYFDHTAYQVSLVPSYGDNCG